MTAAVSPSGPEMESMPILGRLAAVASALATVARPVVVARTSRPLLARVPADQDRQIGVMSSSATPGPVREPVTQAAASTVPPAGGPPPAVDTVVRYVHEAPVMSSSPPLPEPSDHDCLTGHTSTGSVPVEVTRSERTTFVTVPAGAVMSPGRISRRF